FHGCVHLSITYIMASLARFSSQKEQREPASFQSSAASHSPASSYGDCYAPGANDSPQTVQVFIASSMVFRRLSHQVRQTGDKRGRRVEGRAPPEPGIAQLVRLLGILDVDLVNGFDMVRDKGK